MASSRLTPDAVPLDGPPAVDCTGRSLDCDSCRNAAMRAAGDCVPAHACVHDRYARRIDRFFRWNPRQANFYLAHPYFEVRAIACRFGSPFRVRSLARDPHETVRLAVVSRLPQRLLAPLARDADREVRIRVVQRLLPGDLVAMMGDVDYYVRVQVARRLPLAVLARMRDDPDAEVRCEVAQRLPMPALVAMADDAEVSVRRIVARRLPVAALRRMRDDAAWQVRWELTQRCDAALLRHFTADAEPDVADAARSRLAALADGAAGNPHG